MEGRNCLIGKLLTRKFVSIDAKNAFWKIWKLSGDLQIREVGNVPPEEVKMDECAFSVQIHGLPLRLMNEKVAMVVGRSIGRVIDIDTNGNNIAWDRCLRIRV
ncbi:hypothetical protein CRYUN_Cryun13aG0046200 [Craigia yunnanensis]